MIASNMTFDDLLNNVLKDIFCSREKRAVA
jgi:hypothetical protein